MHSHCSIFHGEQAWEHTASYFWQSYIRLSLCMANDCIYYMQLRRIHAIYMATN